MDDNDIFAFDVFYCDIFFCEYVDADLLSVVDNVPKVFKQLVCIIYTCDGQVASFVFIYAEEYGASIGVRERRVCLP